MLRIIEANETEELSELRTVLQKTQLCDAVATLKQFLTLFFWTTIWYELP